MKEKTKVGATISLIGALLGIFLIYISFLQVYKPIMASEVAAGRAGGESIADGVSISKYVMPVVNDIGIIGGVLWAVAAFGFFPQRKMGLEYCSPCKCAQLAQLLHAHSSFKPGHIPDLYFCFYPQHHCLFLITGLCTQG